MKRARWLVTATLVLALAVIALGAYTRLTDAGPTLFECQLRRDPGVRCSRLGHPMF